MQLRPLSALQRRIILHGTQGPTLLNVPGAYRAGKTSAMSIGHASYGVSHPEVYHAIIGYSEDTVMRNVVREKIGTLAYLKSIGINAETSKSEGLHVEYKLDGQWVLTWLMGGGNDTAVNRIAGMTLGSILFDEVTRILEAVFMVAWSRLSEAEAKVWANMNPKGSNHWYKKQVIDHPERYPQLTLNAYHKDNLSLTPQAIQRITRGLYGHEYQRNVKVEWADPAGLIWAHWTHEPAPPIATVQRWTFSLDWASSGVLHALAHAHMPNGTVCTVSEHRHDAADDGVLTEDEHRTKLVGWASRVVHGPIRGLQIVGDPNTSGGFKKLLKRAGFLWKNAKNDVDAGLKRTRVLLADGRHVIDRDGCPHLVDEIGGYIWDEKAAARGEDKPVKQKDHGCDALRYRCFTPLSAPGATASGVWSPR